MRIVFLTSKLNFETSGGSVEEIDFIIRNLQELGNEVTVVTAFSKENKIPKPLPYPVIEEQIASRSLIGVQKDAFFLFKKYESRADFFHIDAHLFMYGAGLYRLLGGKTRIAAFFNQYLMCWPQHISSFFAQPKENLLIKLKKKIRWYIERFIGMFLANQNNLFSFVSPTLRKMYEDFGLENRQSTVIVGDPIDFEKIRREGGVTAEWYVKKMNKSLPIKLFFSSRMSPGKGFDVLLLGFSKVKNKQDFQLVIGGTGPEEQQVKKMVRDLKLESYVEVPGWVPKEQLYKYYREADIFIQADWWLAGTSISLLYAMAFGVPSILPGGGGLEWLAQKSALYFPYRDYEALARKIEQLGKDFDLRAELSRQCALRLKDKDFDYKAHVRNLNSALLRNKD